MPWLVFENGGGQYMNVKEEIMSSPSKESEMFEAYCNMHSEYSISNCMRYVIPGNLDNKDVKKVVNDCRKEAEGTYPLPLHQEVLLALSQYAKVKKRRK